MTIERTSRMNGNGLWNKGGKKVKARKDEGNYNSGETDGYMKHIIFPGSLNLLTRDALS